jgi:hypothetical protein
MALRDPHTRVSLFLRTVDREDFAYLGEMEYRDHRQFTSDGRVQQEYVFSLPEPLLRELSGGNAKATSKPPLSECQRAAASTGRRRPATIDEYKKAFSYSLGRMDRTVVPAHQHYQVRLTQFLRAKNTPVECEGT